jgi:hypothetical protein
MSGVDKYRVPGWHGTWKFLPGAWIFKFILVWFMVFLARICKKKNMLTLEKKRVAPELFLVLSTPDMCNHCSSVFQTFGNCGPLHGQSAHMLTTQLS